MATFKVGQRVRVRMQKLGSIELYGSIVGCEATITSVPAKNGKLDCTAEVDGNGSWELFFHNLSPLTDPAADQFIERIKKLGREPVNTPEKVTV